MKKIEMYLFLDIYRRSQAKLAQLQFYAFSRKIIIFQVEDNWFFRKSKGKKQNVVFLNSFSYIRSKLVLLLEDFLLIYRSQRLDQSWCCG